MALLQNWYGNPIVHSIGWVLLHACWQITLVALLLRVMQPRLVRKSANTLYLAGVTSLMVITIWSAFTFWNQQQHFEEAISIAQLEPLYNKESARLITTSLAEPVEINASQNLNEASPSIIDRLLYYLPVMVVLWFGGILLFLIRLIAGWLRIYHLRTKDLSVINEQWLTRFENLKSKLGINRSIQFFYSARVDTPLTFGFFKPMVLVPIGLFANLSPEMVETVLLHELAHIKRADYLINILQSIVEMIFFFHPGLWWISKIIRESREHACDDIAVAACQDPMLYASTLTQLQISSLTSKNYLAMSLTGTTGNFTTRIKRLFGYIEPTPSKNRSVLFSSLLVTCLLFFAFVPSLETDGYTDGLIEGSVDSEAVTYTITPTTTKMQLDHISNALKNKGITMQISNLEFTSFGLLDNIKLDFELADQRKFMMEAGKLQYIYLSVDLSKDDPLDVRFQCSRMTVSPPDEFGEETTWAMSRPYSTNFSIPSFIGAIGFKTNGDGTDQMVIQNGSDNQSFVIVLNGAIISATELLAKDLKPNDITHIRKLSPAQASEKLNLTVPNGVYEIFAKLDAKGNKRGLFFESKDNPATQYKFKVLHKAELRSINNNTAMGTKPNVEYHISADNCEDNNKALHILNDRILEVPDGACYPPELLALTEVDSFFLYDTDLAQQQFGNESAYVFYYQHHPKEKESTVFDFKPKSTLNIDRVKMESVEWESISRSKDAPISFLNDQALAQNTDGTWPVALTKVAIFDSLIILTSADSRQAYGLNTQEDAWLFYYKPNKTSSTPIAFPEETSEDAERPNILYVLNDEILFTEEGRKSPALLEDIPSDGYDQAIYLNGKDAIDKYGEAGANGVMELYTKPAYTSKDFSDQIQVSPNPFSDEVNIKIALFKKALVKIIVYDRFGRLIADLTEETLDKGYHTFNWMPHANVASGTYFITIQRDKDFKSIPVVYQAR